MLIVLIVLMTVLLRLLLAPALEENARRQAKQAHASHRHDAAASVDLGVWQRLTGADSWSDVAHNFRGDWQMLWKEITIGFFLAGFSGLLGNDFFNGLFVKNAPAARERETGSDRRRTQNRLLDRQTYRPLPCCGR